MSLLFIYIGYKLWKFRDKWAVDGAKLGILIVIMAILPVIPLSMGDYKIPDVYCVIYSILMFIVLYGVGNYVDRMGRLTSFIVFFIKNSIYIMVFHVYTNNIFYVFTQNLALPWPIEFFCSILAIVACIKLKERIV